MNETQTYFQDVPNESDTIILRNDFRNIKDLPIMLQVWAWDGMTAQSAIIPEAFSKHLEEEALIELLRSELKIDDSYTRRNTESYTFINFGFNN